MGSEVDVCNFLLNFQRATGDNPGTARPIDRQRPEHDDLPEGYSEIRTVLFLLAHVAG